MICSSVKRFFTSNLLGVGNWTPNWGATQNWVDVDRALSYPDTAGAHQYPRRRGEQAAGCC
ncbi:hypothetical protein BI317_09895 [Xanthomonas hortorum pv. gardneri]|nr:hypothetical protein BI317_09895 [Xanthomonas hortorum pv. gardneri]